MEIIKTHAEFEKAMLEGRLNEEDVICKIIIEGNPQVKHGSEYRIYFEYRHAPIATEHVLTLFGLYAALKIKK